MLNEITNIGANEIMPNTLQDYHKHRFEMKVENIYSRHFRQTSKEISALKERYAKPIIGAKYIDEHLMTLASVIDPSDAQLWCVSQLTHSLQVAEMMTEDGLDDEFVVAGLIHDIGKVLLYHGEQPENVVCPNEIISVEDSLSGLSGATCHWGHDEFAYQKLKKHLPDDIAWLIRYHSLRFETAQDIMTSQDIERYKVWLEPFRFYDLCSKSVHFLPSKKLDSYRDLLRGFMPNKVVL